MKTRLSKLFKVTVADNKDEESSTHVIIAKDMFQALACAKEVFKPEILQIEFVLAKSCFVCFEDKDEKI